MTCRLVETGHVRQAPVNAIVRLTCAGADGWVSREINDGATRSSPTSLGPTADDAYLDHLAALAQGRVA